jgi:hypothetical protein
MQTRKSRKAPVEAGRDGAEKCDGGASAISSACVLAMRTEERDRGCSADRMVVWERGLRRTEVPMESRLSRRWCELRMESW